MVVYIFTQDSRNTSNVSVAVEQIIHETKLYVTATLFSIYLVSDNSHFLSYPFSCLTGLYRDNVEGLDLALSDFDSVHRFVKDLEAKNIPS